MAGQGKFDALTKELITLVMGFQEGEENFVRSEQYVLSNLLYHHCLDVNSHAVRRSMDGLALKFTIHGQHSRAKRLTSLATKFLASPLFKDHSEADIEWSLLSLLLHLSNSPTQVPVELDSPPIPGLESLPQTPGCEEEEKEEEVDWAAYLNDEIDDYSIGSEESLSDWSSDEDSEDKLEGAGAPLPASSQTLKTHPLPQDPTQSQQPIQPPRNLFTLPPDPDPQNLSAHTSIPPIDNASFTTVSPNSLPRHPLAPLRQPQVPQVNATQEAMEQLHRAKSWLSANTHRQYWDSKYPSQPAVSDHPAANLAKLWETDQGLRNGSVQQLAEWEVMREVVWILISPTPTHVFTCDDKGTFSIKQNFTIPSLTPEATRKLLATLCEALSQLTALNSFMCDHQCAGKDPRTLPSVTLQAYATGLRCWRQRFLSHLLKLEERIKDQESTCTLLWLEAELQPWLRILATVYSVHRTALPSVTPDSATTGYVAVRLLGTLCEAVDSAGDGQTRAVLVRLLLHSFRHYLAITHSWLFHGILQNYTSEFVVKREETVKVNDERFWHEAFTVSLQYKTLDPKDPVHTMMKLLSPLLASLTFVGKARELLAVLESSTDLTTILGEDNLYTDSDVPLAEKVVNCVKKSICKLSKECQVKDKPSSTDMRRTTGSEGERKRDLYVTPSRDQMDPLLWAAFSETQQDSEGLNGSLDCHHMDSVTRLIEEISEAPRAISSVFVLSSAIRPLVSDVQEQLSARLTRSLLDHHSLHRHCQAVRAVYLMEAGDMMHEFYSHLFAKVDEGENIDALSLTFHLQYCVSRLYPKFAQYFYVTISHNEDAPQISKEIAGSSEAEDCTDTLLIDGVGGSGREALKRLHEKARQLTKVPSSKTSSAPPLVTTGLPELYIQYQAPLPANHLLTEGTIKQFNLLFNFLLCLKRVTNGLERLKFKDLSGWHLATTVVADSEDGSDLNDSPASPLLSRLHRLQLLRHWLLFFSRELHNHFANAAFLPYYCAVEKLFQTQPSFNTILTEHDKLLKKLMIECLMGSNEKILPLQGVLNKLFGLTQRLSELWVREAGGVKGCEVTKLETQYASLHRYLAHFLTAFTKLYYVPHIEGLTRTLVDTVPLLA
ncbi:hypothetical protein Pcinc_037542 [Petrolisthes cinctipes]|uniref:Gamma-tubulin complex component n=1 Tax=Petrolisthes cinctipes TaxID=88211 RepID=A0AAE1BSJ7_PETCI|nr:hypothetical protein Pcinc_037542 [Petrolisthes cinctipes]